VYCQQRHAVTDPLLQIALPDPSGQAIVVHCDAIPVKAVHADMACV
jgi:hypothetical protein